MLHSSTGIKVKSTERSHTANAQAVGSGEASGELTGKAESASPRGLLTALCTFYLLLVIPLSIWQRDLLNSDGISFIRKASYLAEGRLLDSVSSYWSPLLIWSLAPFDRLGVDALYASRVVLVIWGLALLLASHLFVRRCTSLSAVWGSVALALIVLGLANWTTQMLNADVPMAACLLAYSAFAGGSDLLVRRRSQIFAGLLGGVAFLAKAYALPFVLVHFGAVLLARHWLSPNARWQNSLRAWLIGLASLALIAGTWIGVLSWKYGELTISSAGAINHAIVGPGVVAGTQPWHVHPIDSMRPPPPGQLTLWEEPENLPYGRWSPLTSSSHFRHQLEVMRRNFLAILVDLGRFDASGFGVAGIFGLQIFLMLQGLPSARFRFLYTAGTIGIYVAGFLPLWYEERYLQALLWPICCISLLEALRQAAGTTRVRRIVGAATTLSARHSLSLSRPLSLTGWVTGWAITGLVLLSLALPWTPYVQHGLTSLVRFGPKEYYRSAAARMQRAGFEGPLAATSEFQDEVMFFAYHLAEPSVGVVTGTRVEQVVEELAAHRVQTFFADSRWPLTRDFAMSAHWKRRGTIEAGGQSVILFTPRGRALGPHGDRTGQGYPGESGESLE